MKNELTDAGAWQHDIAYDRNSVVRYDGRGYVSNVANKNHRPQQGGTYFWRALEESEVENVKPSIYSFPA